MNFRVVLLQEIEVMEKKVTRYRDWIEALDKDNFDWDNVTPDQEDAIRRLCLPIAYKS